MNETVYVYIVHSDIDENNIYAEFRTEEEAIDYARRNKDELTYVDKVEVALDEDGDIIEMFDSETIWVYDEEDDDEEYDYDEDEAELSWSVCIVDLDSFDSNWVTFDSEEEATNYYNEYCDKTNVSVQLYDPETMVDSRVIESLDTKTLTEETDQQRVNSEIDRAVEQALKFKLKGRKGAFVMVNFTTDDVDKLYDYLQAKNLEADIIKVSDFNKSSVVEQREVFNKTLAEGSFTIFISTKEDQLDPSFGRLALVIANITYADSTFDKGINNKEIDFDALVEDLEENEDMVECKECFELFPKTTGTKHEHGYVCPHCARHVHTVDVEPDFEVNDFEVFALDFPEVERITGTDYPEVAPDCVGPECEVVEPTPETEVEPAEAEAPVEAPVTKEETIDTLVRDEQEAIEGYEKAKVEIEANSEMTEEEKEAVLEVIEHIKEEEIEHIEELTELVETEEDDKAEDVAEPEVLNEGIKEDIKAYGDKLEADIAKYDYVNIVAGLLPIDYGWDTNDVGFSGYEDLAVDVYKEGNTYCVLEYLENENGPVDGDPEVTAEFETMDDLVRYLLDRKYITEAEVSKTSITEETHAKYAKPEGDRRAAYNNALVYAKKENKPFIYGYTNHTGKFFALAQPIKMTKEPAECEKEFRHQYKNCSVVAVVYPDKSFLREKLNENLTSDFFRDTILVPNSVVKVLDWDKDDNEFDKYVIDFDDATDKVVVKITTIGDSGNLETTTEEFSSVEEFCEKRPDIMREVTDWYFDEEESSVGIYAIYNDGDYIGTLEAKSEDDAVDKCYNGAFGMSTSDDMFTAELIDPVEDLDF